MLVRESRECEYVAAGTKQAGGGELQMWWEGPSCEERRDDAKKVPSCLCSYW